MKKYLPLLLKILAVFKRYAVIIVVTVFGALYGYLIYYAGQQAKLEPSQTDVNEAFKGSSRPRLDPAVAEQMRALQESPNTELRAIFDDARNNPFSE